MLHWVTLRFLKWFIWVEKNKKKSNLFEFSQTFENIKIIRQSISKVQLEHVKAYYYYLFHGKGKN